MIELLSKAWNLSIPNAVRKARESGVYIAATQSFDALIDDYMANVYERRKEVDAVWERAKSKFSLAESGELRGLQAKIGVRGPYGPDWSSKGGQFIGAANKAELELFMSSKMPRNYSISRNYLFGNKGGGKWGDLLVVPFYDLPNRICAFMCIGRNVAGPEDVVMLPAYGMNGRNSERQTKPGTSIWEGGVCMLPALYCKRPINMSNNIFVMDDPIMAVRLQLRHLKDSALPLPLVSITPAQSKHVVTKSVWDWLPIEKVVCWSTTPSMKLLELSKRADASVSMANMSTFDLDTNLRDRTPMSWLNRAATTSAEWPIVLRRILNKQTIQEIQDTLLDIDLGGAELRKFIEDSDPDLGERLKLAVEQKTNIKRVQFKKNTVTERDGSWYLRMDSYKREELICNAIIRIEQVMRTSNNNNYYRGIVIFKGKEYVFTEPTETLENDSLTWLKEFLINKDAGTLLHGSSSMSKSLLQIALRFCDPQIVAGADVIGWDSDQRQFNLPNYGITANGEINTDYGCLFTDDLVPGRDLQEPERLYQRTAAALSEDNEEVRLFWATFACVLHNVIAPAMCSHPRGILLDGVGAHRIGASAAAYLGCVEAYLDKNRESYLRKLTPKHHWPTLFLKPGQLDDHASVIWLNSDAARQAIMPVSPFASRVLGMRGQWHIIRCENKLGVMHGLSTAAAKAMPSYLQDLCKRKFWIPQQCDTEVVNILHDMSKWLDREGGNGKTVLSAIDMIETPERKAPLDHFVELVLCLRNNGSLSFARDGFETARNKGHRPCIKYFADSSQLWVPQDAVCDLVHEKAHLPLDLIQVTESLTDAGVCKGVARVDDQKGWMIDAEWYAKKEKEMEKVYDKSAKAMGRL
jgi:hypothetical protein